MSRPCRASEIDVKAMPHNGEIEEKRKNRELGEEQAHDVPLV